MTFYFILFIQLEIPQQIETLMLHALIKFKNLLVELNNGVR